MERQGKKISVVDTPRQRRRAPAGAAVGAGAFESVFDAAPDAILVVDPRRGTVVRANPAAERALGYARLIGRPLSRLFRAPSGVALAALVERARCGGIRAEVYEMRRGDGLACPMALSAALAVSGGDELLVLTLRDVTEQRRLEQGLRTAEERLELIVQGGDIGLWDWDLRSGALVFNPRAVEMLGYAVDELAPQAQSWLELVHPDDAAAVAVAVAAHVRGETERFVCEQRLRSKSGEWVWVSTCGRVVQRDADGRAVRAIGTQLDVTALKRAEEERAALIEMAKDISATVDLYELVARVQRRTVGVVPADVVATFYWDAEREAYAVIAHEGVTPERQEDASRLTLRLGEAFGGKLATGETVVVDDPERWGPAAQAAMAHFGVRGFAAVPLVVRGQVRGAFCAGLRTRACLSAGQVHLLESIARQLAVGIETTALYRAQQAEAEYSGAQAQVGQELIASLTTPAVYARLCRVAAEVLHCDVSQTFIWRADEGAYAAAAAHGDTPEEREAVGVLRLSSEMTAALRVGLAQTGLVRLEDLPPEDPVRRGLTAVLPLSAAIFVALRRGGGEEMMGFLAAGYRGGLPAHFTAQHERIARGIAQIASLALDNARLVEELERAHRVKSDFVATISHELRTPLSTIIGYHDLLLEGEFGPLSTEQADRLQRADRSARELLDLINATLDLSRLEGGRMPVYVRDTDLDQLLDELDADLSAGLQKPGVQFAWQRSARLPHLRTDGVKLKVILKNLVRNAIKFTDAGSVTVRVTPHAEYVEFEVADTGIGIPAELHEAIFEPFRQADGSSTRGYGGVGLGLYIVKRLLDVLGGEIVVKSEVGHGSSFCVRIPTGAAGERPAESGGEAAAARG